VISLQVVATDLCSIFHFVLCSWIKPSAPKTCTLSFEQILFDLLLGQREVIERGIQSTSGTGLFRAVPI
jgi:hypothetical protein